MASRKSFLSKPTSNYIFPSSTTRTTTPPAENHFNPKSSSSSSSQHSMLDFDEAELWNNNNNNNNYEANNNNNKKALSSSASSRSSNLKRSSGPRKKVVDMAQHQACSMPINIPDWSKILKDEYKEHRKWESNDDDDDDDDCDEDLNGGIRVPPHEYLARTRGASLSVHEGIGRTLKGRDLRSVRNAIWKKVGFED